MRKTGKYVLGGVAAILVIIQFIPNQLPETSEDNAGDLIKSGMVSEEVAVIMKAACYDCHSNQTRYPWYSYVAPVSWLVKYDVEEGRKELNFSEWTTAPKRRIIKKLEEIGEMVQEGEMPKPVYTLTHRDARLTDQQRELIIQWAKNASEQVLAN
jgi:hypothetical protein